MGHHLWRFLNLPTLYCRASHKVNRLVVLTSRLQNYSSKQSSEEQEDAPIKFTTSPAASWSAKHTRVGTSEETDDPPFQQLSILVSLTVFMIYFCVLREENDVDEELSKSLYDRIDGLEKKQLELSLHYNTEHNMDTTAIEKRLEELDKEEEESKKK